MIRMAVGGESEFWQSVAIRLRGVETVFCFDATNTTSLPKDCDAVLFVDSRYVVPTLVEQWFSLGKHVLVIGGSWLTMEWLDSLATSARQSGVQFAVVNPDHYLPSRQLIRQQLDAGKLGEPGLIRIHRWEGIAAAVPVGSGQIPSPLILDLELAIWLAGKTPDLIYVTETSQLDSASPAGRTIQVHLGFPGGSMAMIDYSGVLPTGEGYSSLSVIGSSGAGYADDHQNMQLLYQGSDPRAFRTDEGIRQWVGLSQEFVDALLVNRDLAPCLANWRGIIPVVQAVEESLASRQAVSLEGI